MAGRELLGTADVSDERLTTIVAAALNEPTAGVLAIRVDPVDYDLPAITTAGRWWVSGEASTPAGVRPFRIFVKKMENWSRSPLFSLVPAELRDFAAASVPWRTEAAVYRSDLADRLPGGLEMPRALAVIDIDEMSSAVWLEPIPDHCWPWDLDRYGRAAALLGRLAGSSRVAPLAQIDDHQWTIHDYQHGRFEHQVEPMLNDDELWRHPLLAAAFGDELRARMVAALAKAPGWFDELAAAPQLPGHGDACPNNLLGTERPDTFVLIDFAFWKPLPLGFDLGQLLLGEAQLGRGTAGTLPEIEARIVPAYLAGLRDEGISADERQLRRWHALQMAVFSGLSTMPVEHLGDPIGPEVTRLAAARAAITTYCLDLVDASSGG